MSSIFWTISLRRMALKEQIVEMDNNGLGKLGGKSKTPAVLAAVLAVLVGAVSLAGIFMEPSLTLSGA